MKKPSHQMKRLVNISDKLYTYRFYRFPTMPITTYQVQGFNLSSFLSTPNSTHTTNLHKKIEERDKNE
ncbi:hypothetical protein GGR21_003930 [Dysgonomonas hofstadii]|uniref:Uncharacterized protein n=1 Tax=Dysgonomonas hofstadii TaxID=637886 RepID=A0A840CWM7_9BACT|nr:hypothetical protein [Dysgonomonas hofstadii]